MNILKAIVNYLRQVRAGKYSKSTEILIASSGQRLCVSKDLAWAFSSGDYYEVNVIAAFDRVFRAYSKPIFFDIGANCGYFTLRYAPACQQVFAFEPVKGTFTLLRKNIRQNALRNVKPFALGLSDKPGRLEINIYNSSGNNSIFERKVPEGHSLKKTGTERISLKTLDHLVETHLVLPPDIIKIDVEGAELMVLKGGLTTIRQYRPTLLMEYSDNTAKDAGYSKEALLEAVHLADYAIIGIPEEEHDLRLIPLKDFGREKLSNIICIPFEKNISVDGES